MILTIRSLHLQNFKGVKDETYVFDSENSVVEGKNGSGKSTIANGWFWLMADKDIALHSNPDIRPIGVEECTPRVEAVIDIDGKVITIAKQQKRTVSKPNADGISKISLSNSYEINSVPKSERDFKDYLADCGVNFDLFLPLCHAEVFTEQKTADMRKALFSMIPSITDYDVASQMNDVPELLALLPNYTVEEVTAMQKATLRKISEEYGKDGEILRATIEGLESAKADIDLSALELAKADAQRRLDEIQAQKAERLKRTQEVTDISYAIVKAESERDKYISDYAKVQDSAVKALREELYANREEVARLNGDKSVSTSKIESYETYIRQVESSINQYKAQMDTIKASKFDENTAICPTCGQTLPTERVGALRAEFENSKADKIDRLRKSIEEFESRKNLTIQQIKDLTKKFADSNKKIADLLSRRDEIEKSISRIEKDTIPANETDEYKALQGKIDELNSKRNEMFEQNKADTLDTSETEIREELRKINMDLGKSESNLEIDDKIVELRNKQTAYEQNRADAENILYQISLLNKRKNELLTDGINSNFKRVKWVLFRYAKNGNYEDCCVPTIDGKELGVSTNNALGISAKVDICEGMQKFYGQHYPILLDNIEAIDSQGRKALVSDSQLIMFAVTDSALTVKEA